MRINTASEAISLLRETETSSAAFYRSLAELHEAHEAFFLGLEKENKRFITDIQRTYFGVITDALEGCYAFDLDPSEYGASPPTAKGRLAEDLAAALDMEGRITRLYRDAAAQSKCLMADVPRVMERVVKTRTKRQEKLTEMVRGSVPG